MKREPTKTASHAALSRHAKSAAKTARSSTRRAK
jgi:hypothetical protein